MLCKTRLSANRNKFILPFQLGAFYFFSYLITLARTLSIMLNRSGKSERALLVPDLRGKAFSFSPLSCGLLRYGFYCAVCFTHNFLKNVIMKECYILSNAFVSIELIS